MQERTRQRLLLFAGLLVAVLLGAWWYSGFSLEFMRFFAAEPDVTATATVAPIPPDNSGQVKCSPATQTVKVGVAAALLGSSGDGSYEWFSPDGTPATGAGGSYSVVYATVGTKKVTVQSKRSQAPAILDSVACTVVVQP